MGERCERTSKWKEEQIAQYFTRQFHSLSTHRGGGVKSERTSPHITPFPAPFVIPLPILITVDFGGTFAYMCVYVFDGIFESISVTFVIAAPFSRQLWPCVCM